MRVIYRYCLVALLACLFPLLLAVFVVFAALDGIYLTYKTLKSFCGIFMAQYDDLIEAWRSV